MWKVIYIAQSLRMAEKIKQRLSEEGFLVKTRAIHSKKPQYEILVPSAELEEIQELLNHIVTSP